jgi:hypothetical protein
MGKRIAVIILKFALIFVLISCESKKEENVSEEAIVTINEVGGRLSLCVGGTMRNSPSYYWLRDNESQLFILS